jgi:hypothetical protein
MKIDALKIELVRHTIFILRLVRSDMETDVQTVKLCMHELPYQR